MTPEPALPVASRPPTARCHVCGALVRLTPKGRLAAHARLLAGDERCLGSQCRGPRDMLERDVLP
jgi:hypothetical protein